MRYASTDACSDWAEENKANNNQSVDSSGTDLITDSMTLGQLQKLWNRG